MSSSYLKAQEDGRQKRAKIREEMRVRFAGQALSGLIMLNQGYKNPDSLAEECVAIADALIRRLGYARDVKPSDLTEEEKQPLD
jgi:hypothetical protein